MGLALVVQVLEYFCHFVHFPAELVDFRKLLDVDFIDFEDLLLLLVDIVLALGAEQVRGI
jgi:hypothetical protein